MNSNPSAPPTPEMQMKRSRFRVGVFTLAGLLAIGAVTVFINDKPFWWRACQPVTINIEDATGLKAKSPVRSLGIQVGYLKSINLSETTVALGICLTAPVEVLPSTRAYVRSEGFLGDKFVELKPLRYVGDAVTVSRVWDWLVPAAQAEETPIAEAPAEAAPVETGSAVVIKRPGAPATTGTKRTKRTNDGSREIPVGDGSQDMTQLVGRVDGLVQEMTQLTTNLKQALNPEEMRTTMRQLNKTLENASKTLSPEGGINTTAQRVLSKLEDAIEQLRDQMTRVNQGKGSLGMLLNDPVYADEVRESLKNLNKLLGKVNRVRFVVDVGGQTITGYEGGRGAFKLQIWPTETRYYLVGISVDPRGRRTNETITTTSNGQTSVVETTRVESTGLLLTGMLGKVLWKRVDLSIGAYLGDGTARVGVNLGPHESEDKVQAFAHLYTHSGVKGVDMRGELTARPFGVVYGTLGVESMHRVSGKIPWILGGGVSFDDEDIKLLFAFK